MVCGRCEAAESFIAARCHVRGAQGALIAADQRIWIPVEASRRAAGAAVFEHTPPWIGSVSGEALARAAASSLHIISRLGASDCGLSAHPLKCWRVT